MLGVCDTTPLNYLVQIELIDLIARLYEQACIPQAVFRELLHPAAPSSVRQWAYSLPKWISVRHAGAITDPTIGALDRGEREAIALATSLGAQFLLTDDYRARVAARNRGVATLTTCSSWTRPRTEVGFRSAMPRSDCCKQTSASTLSQSSSWWKSIHKR